MCVFMPKASYANRIRIANQHLGVTQVQRRCDAGGQLVQRLCNVKRTAIWDAGQGVARAQKNPGEPGLVAGTFWRTNVRVLYAARAIFAIRSRALALHG